MRLISKAIEAISAKPFEYTWPNSNEAQFQTKYGLYEVRFPQHGEGLYEVTFALDGSYYTSNINAPLKDLLRISKTIENIFKEHMQGRTDTIYMASGTSAKRTSIYQKFFSNYALKNNLLYFKDGNHVYLVIMEDAEKWFDISKKTGIGYQNLLSWKKAGFTPEEMTSWYNAVGSLYRFTPKYLRRLIDEYGLTPQQYRNIQVKMILNLHELELLLSRDIDIDVFVKYMEILDDTEDAVLFIGHDIPIEVVEQWYGAALYPHNIWSFYTSWGESNDFTPEEASLWQNTGIFKAHEAAELRKNNITPEMYTKWKAVGPYNVKIEEIVKLSELNISPEEYYRWSNEDFTFSQIVNNVFEGVSLSEAIEDRNKYSMKLSSEHQKQIELMKFLSRVAIELGVAKHVYVVGGAVRNFVIDKPIKDIDIVIDSISLGGKDSAWFANELAKKIPVNTNYTVNQYGVSILTIKEDWFLGEHNLKDEVIEIANARTESYGGEAGKGYKPDEVNPATIEEDVLRREFTMNTLLWRLLDLTNGPEKAEIVDLTGCGLEDLNNKVLQCPRDPDIVFSDDPTRLLRVIKFVAKYDFKVPDDLRASIKRNVNKLKNAPWEAIGTLFVENVLKEPTAPMALRLMKDLGMLEVVADIVIENKAFYNYLARQLNSQNVFLLLDLLDLGFEDPTPLNKFSPEQVNRIKEIVSVLSGVEAEIFINVLNKPPVDNNRFIEEFSLEGRDRSLPKTYAQEAILQDPSLVFDQEEMNEVVYSMLSNKLSFVIEAIGDTEPYPITYYDNDEAYFDIDSGGQYRVGFDPMRGSNNVFSVDFSYNGSFDRTPDVDKREKLKILSTIKEAFNELLKRNPGTQLIYTSPTTNSRKKLYKRFFQSHPLIKDHIDAGKDGLFGVLEFDDHEAWLKMLKRSNRKEQLFAVINFYYAGFDADEADYFMNRGILSVNTANKIVNNPELERWLDLGIPTEYLEDWMDSEFTPEEAKEWIDLGIEGQQAPIFYRVWKSTNLDFDQIKYLSRVLNSMISIREAVRSGYDLKKAYRLYIKLVDAIEEYAGSILYNSVHYNDIEMLERALSIHAFVRHDWIRDWVSGPMTVEEIREWSEFFEKPHQARQWYDLKVFTPQQAVQLVISKMSADNAKMLVDDYKLSAEEIIEWSKLRRNIHDIIEFLKLDIPLEEAKKWWELDDHAHVYIGRLFKNGIDTVEEYLEVLNSDDVFKNMGDVAYSLRLSQ